MFKKLGKHYHHHPHGRDMIWYFLNGLMTFCEIRGFFKGNIYKYLDRYPYKNKAEDLAKSRDYMEKLQEFEEKYGKYEPESKLQGDDPTHFINAYAVSTAMIDKIEEIRKLGSNPKLLRELVVLIKAQRVEMREDGKQRGVQVDEQAS